MNSGGAGYGAGTSSGQETNSSLCLADAGSPCDDCETRWCCAQRSDCYEDPVCTCADQALDQCQRLGSSDASMAACWNSFAAEGTVEALRVQCLQAWCAEVCDIPQNDW